MKTVAIIQARTSSKRLPGKVLRNISGKPMLQHVVERVTAADSIDHVIVATSSLQSDDRVAALADFIGVECFRGSLDDVLSRYYEAASSVNADTVVRITADCPLISPQVIDRMVAIYLELGADYVVARANDTAGGYPRGTNVEVFSYAMLQQIHKEATTPSQREHVTKYFDDYSSRFRSFRVDAEPCLNRPSYRLTVDTAEDLCLVRRIFARCRDKNNVSLQDAVDLLDARPSLSFVNVRPKILFRVDANVAIGTGNFCRCRMLAFKLEALGYETIFLSKRTDISTGLSGKHQTNTVYLSESKNAETFETVEILRRINPVAVITDLTEISPAHARTLRRYAGMFINICPESATDTYSDIEVDGDLVPRKKTEGGIGEYFLGPRYKIIGSPFVRVTPRPICEEIKNVLVYMGGTDPGQLTRYLLPILSDWPDIHIQVIIGQGNNQGREIGALAKKFSNLEVLGHCPDFLQVLSDADLAFVSGGLTLYEAAMLGIPAVVLSQNRPQLEDADTLQRYGCCISLGQGKVGRAKVLHALEELSDISKRTEMSSNGKKLLDGKGAARVAQIIHGRLSATVGKSALVIGGGLEQVNLVEAGKCLGLRMVCADRNMDAPAKKCADAFYQIDTSDAAAISAIAKKHSVKAVLTSTESGVLSAASAASARRLVSTGKKVASVFTNKLRMKGLFQRVGIRSAPFTKVETFADALKFAERQGFPVVVKPCDNAGARGVVRATDKKTLEHALAEAWANTKLDYLLVEKYIFGPEFGCETFSYGNEKLVVLTEKLKSRAPHYVVMGHVTGVEHERMEDFVRDVITKLFLQGPVNMDIILGEDGPTLIECGVRLGGNHLPQLSYLSTGVNTYLEAIKYALGVEPAIVPRWHKAAAVRYFCPKPGKVVGFDGFGNDLIGNDVISVDLDVKKGHRIVEVGDVSQRVGSFVLCGDSRSDVKAKIVRFNKSNRILTTP